MSAFSTLSWEDFTYKGHFRDLTEAQFNEAREIILALWSGVLEMWEVLPEDVKLRKRSAVMNLLVAWYLADTYPTKVVGGVQTSGGMPMTRKRIRDVDISFKALDLPESYQSLASNQFGIKAANLIRYAPDMMGVYG